MENHVQQSGRVAKIQTEGGGNLLIRVEAGACKGIDAWGNGYYWQEGGEARGDLNSSGKEN